MVGTTLIHAGGMAAAVSLFQVEEEQDRNRNHIYLVLRIGMVILVMFLATVMEVLLWAVTYLLLADIEGLEDSLYFSMVTFTTLGYGDVVLDENWRLLSSIEAVNGIIMFGWTTAIVLAAVQRIYFGVIPPGSSNPAE